ncbi:MAG TPA: ABC transporter permease [Bryobacteraceae bacterium]|nr:ABC transporter permease [Bryobacteraceae bacterium]
MKIPLAYNVRNLAVRKTSTLMTALGIALTVAVLLAVMAMVAGLKRAFAETGNPLNVLVMRKGATSELVSWVRREAYNDLRYKPGVMRNTRGEPMTSMEMITVITIPSISNPDGSNVNLRGITSAGIEMRPEMHIIAGRWFQPGRREIVVGSGVAKRYPAARLGKKLEFGKGVWDIVGVFEAGASAINSEILADLNQASSDYNRFEGGSSVLVRATDLVAANALINELRADQRLNVMAVPETKYYNDQTASAIPVQAMGTFVACIMAIGSIFAAMNTMYAAVARRAREIGTLRVLGFSRRGILTSFFLESLCLSLLGGLLGCILVLPLNNLTTSMGSWTTFSEVAFNFRVTPPIMLVGVVFALFMGVFGGLLPARMAAKKEILTALREG